MPADPAEHFAGYALMGMPFSSGHYLAFRRFPASSIGPGYHAVWLRSPGGEWSVHADVPPELSCARYFGQALTEARQTPVTATWTTPWQLTVRVPGVVQWELELEATPTTTAMTVTARHLPPAAWRSKPTLNAMGRTMGPALHAGKMTFSGLVPNGQSFQARPLRVWAVRNSKATIGGVDAGTPHPLPRQDRLAGFWLPQRGLFISDLSLRFPSTAAAHTPALAGTEGGTS
jgi:hypothetical protein